jgi:hypothetical protein
MSRVDAILLTVPLLELTTSTYSCCCVTRSGSLIMSRMETFLLRVSSEVVTITEATSVAFFVVVEATSSTIILVEPTAGRFLRRSRLMGLRRIDGLVGLPLHDFLREFVECLVSTVIVGHLFSFAVFNCIIFDDDLEGAASSGGCSFGNSAAMSVNMSTLQASKG